MTPLEKFPPPYRLVTRTDGLQHNVYCGGTPIALCVPDTLAPMFAAAPAMLAALKYARDYADSHEGPAAWTFRAMLNETIDNAEGR